MPRCIAHGPEKRLSKSAKAKTKAAAKAKAKATAKVKAKGAKDAATEEQQPEKESSSTVTAPSDGCCSLTRNYKDVDPEAATSQKRIVKGTLCGFSCKAFSRANQNFSTNRKSMKDSLDNTSVKTFNATAKVLQSLSIAGPGF